MDTTACDKQNASDRSLDALLGRAEVLLHELKTFHSRLQECEKHNAVEFRAFHRGVKSEIKQLNTIAKRRQEKKNIIDDDENEDGLSGTNDIHALRSSNLPFYETVWSTAKSCQGVSALCRRIYWQKPGAVIDTDVSARSSKDGNRHVKETKQTVVVDIVAEDGLKWIKASTITNKRLLFEMAKEGWVGYEDSFSDEEESDGRSSPARSSTDISRKLDLVKLAYYLTEAASLHRSNFKHPRVHFILPNVIEHQYPDVDAVLHEMRSIGVKISCPSSNTQEPFSVGSDVPLSEAMLNTMIPRSHVAFTAALNIDCTILLALISDISHVAQKDLPSSPENRSGTYHTAILRQIECEAKDPLVPNELYGILGNRHLVCTSHAADRMYEIVRTMGTDSEKQRAAIFLASDQYSTLGAGQLRESLAKLSCHVVPDTLRLPIDINHFDQITGYEGSSSFVTSDISTKVREMRIKDTIPKTQIDAISQPIPSSYDMQIAIQLQETMNLSPINKSVFLYGWTTKIVTVTSNKVVATNITKTIDQLLDEHERQQKSKSKSNPDAGTQALYEEPDFVGPEMYVCETARSLVGKEKQIQPIFAPRNGGVDTGTKSSFKSK